MATEVTEDKERKAAEQAAGTGFPPFRTTEVNQNFLIVVSCAVPMLYGDLLNLDTFLERGRAASTRRLSDGRVASRRAASVRMVVPVMVVMVMMLMGRRRTSRAGRRGRTHQIHRDDAAVATVACVVRWQCCQLTATRLLIVLVVVVVVMVAVVVVAVGAIYKDGCERYDGGGGRGGGGGGRSTSIAAAATTGRRAGRWKGRFGGTGERLMMADGCRRRYCHCRVSSVATVR
uniref:Uncharacterized protein n=1 Tax=Anopheles farauti TaxID=69004 RepID=A0A182QQR6_9DIPT